MSLKVDALMKLVVKSGKWKNFLRIHIEILLTRKEEIQSKMFSFFFFFSLQAKNQPESAHACCFLNFFFQFLVHYILIDFNLIHTVFLMDYFVNFLIENLFVSFMCPLLGTTVFNFRLLETTLFTHFLYQFCVDSTV